MSYNPQVYSPNSTKTIFSTVESSTNSAVIANDRIVIESTGFSHPDCSVNGSGQLVFTGGEHVICYTPMATMNPASSSTETPFTFRWYDVTNSQFLGVAGRTVTRQSSYTMTIQRAPLSVAYVNAAITVEIRCVSTSGASVNAWNSLNLTYYGRNWGYIYSAIG